MKGLKVIGNWSANVDQVVYDSRKVSSAEGQVFFALQGDFRNGHDFIEDAYEKGIRLFVIEDLGEVRPDACYVVVENCLKSLQELAKTHRESFNIPVLAITGSTGKTTVKEWVYHLLKGQLHITRSPKSYNSQLGVALSLLMITEETQLAIIEAGISKPGEMELLREMIQPTLGIFTNIGSAHRENFENAEQHLREKLSLFNKVSVLFSLQKLENHDLSEKTHVLDRKDLEPYLKTLPFSDEASYQSALLATGFVKYKFRIDNDKINSLPRLALRLETFDGIDNSLIINDTYNLDLDSLKIALEYQLSIAKDNTRIAIIGLDKDNQGLKKQVVEVLQGFHPIQIFFCHEGFNTSDMAINSAIVLVKGQRAQQMEKIAQKLKLKHHKTQLAFNLSAVKNNLSIFKNKLSAGTKLLCMVKAQSYGAGLEKMGAFLEKCGVDYLGVAYSDEGVELRMAGIKLPIIVMNPEEDGYENCVLYNLEPTVYSQTQLEELIKEMIYLGKERLPIHLKIDTGMHRLGISPNELSEVLEVIQAQPEVEIKGVYSHLAEAENTSSKAFTEGQITTFSGCVEQVLNKYPDIIVHLCNSEGALNFPEAHFNMVRVGIGLYGISKNPSFAALLKPVVEWKSVVSQVKEIFPGDSVGYGRSFIAEVNLKIAVIPVGYADGIPRNLSNGKGAVFIHQQRCAIVGMVCMDMIMVNVTHLRVEEGDRVEIIGSHQTLEQLAHDMGTIPYEVLTGLSKRVYRTYFEE